MTFIFLSVDADATNRGNLAPGENFTGAPASNNASDAVHTTTSLSEKNVEYVLSQQVSSAGKSEHALSFSVDPKIYIPEMSDSETKASEFVQEENQKSGEYGTYDKVEKTVELKVDTSKLQYATLNFASLKLSPYSKMTITSYSDAEMEDVVGTPQILKGEAAGLAQTDFAYQIPITQGVVKYINVKIETAGQVETDMNEGFHITNITGVYNKAVSASDGDFFKLETASVSWEAVKPVYSEITRLSIRDDADVAKLTTLGLPTDGTKIDRYEYQVPVFPYTGNSVIKGFDSNNKVVAYYLAPTVKGTVTVAGSENKNTNILDLSGDVKAYEATQEEAETILTSGVTSKDNVVTVNSENSGSTTLKGTISIAGLGDELLDDVNKKIYTSVQWNPIPKVETSDSNAFAAIAGQKITVYAQLTDKNGNKVSQAGEQITFAAKDANGTSDTIDTDDTDTDFAGAGVVKVAETDVNGRATLVLSSAQELQVLNLTAEASTKYNVQLVIGDKTAPQADLYWINANLQFLKNVGEDTYQSGDNKNTTNNDTLELSVESPFVGTPWEYAVKAVGGKIEKPGKNLGVLDGYTIDIDGLKINMSSYDSNKGTYKSVGNGKMSAESEYTNIDTLQAKLNADSVGDTITFTARKTNKDDIVLACVGEGTPNMNSKINLTVDWQTQGAAIKLIAPNGTNINKDVEDTDTAVTKLYVKLTDGSGKNSIPKTTVTFTSDNNDDVFCTDYVPGVGVPGTGTWNASNTTTVETSDKGIAVVYVKSDTSAHRSSIISAKVGTIEQVASTTINYVDATKTPDFGVVRARMVEGTSNQIELTFNNEVNAETLRADEFELTSYDTASSKTTTYDVTAAKASGKKVILTVGQDLSANEYTVSIDAIEKDGITYNLTDEVGNALVKADKNATIDLYSSKNASFNIKQEHVAGTNNVEITVSGIKTPNDDDFATNDNDFKANFVVVYGNKILNITTTGSDVTTAAAGSAGTFTFTLAKGTEKKTLEIFYLGGYESETIGAADSTAPTVQLDTTNSDENTVILTFNEALYDSTSVALNAPFTVSDYFTASDSGTISAMAYDSTKKQITLTLGADFVNDETITLTASKLFDASGNAVATITLKATVADGSTTWAVQS